MHSLIFVPKTIHPIFRNRRSTDSIIVKFSPKNYQISILVFIIRTRSHKRLNTQVFNFFKFLLLNRNFFQTLSCVTLGKVSDLRSVFCLPSVAHNKVFFIEYLTLTSSEKITLANPWIHDRDDSSG
jgi:hypothetical protein